MGNSKNTGRQNRNQYNKSDKIPRSNAANDQTHSFGTENHATPNVDSNRSRPLNALAIKCASAKKKKEAQISSRTSSGRVSIICPKLTRIMCNPGAH